MGGLPVEPAVAEDQGMEVDDDVEEQQQPDGEQPGTSTAAAAAGAPVAGRPQRPARLAARPQVGTMTQG